MKRLLILSFVLLLQMPQIIAGGWLKGKEKGFFKLNQTVIHGNQFYNGDGEIKTITTTGVYLTSLYGEYGIADKFDAIAYVPFVARQTLNSVKFSSGIMQDGDELTSIGDAQIGVKYGIRQNQKLVISATLLLGLPIGDDSGGETELLQTGDGEFNQMVLLEAGYSFDFPLYANVGIGINNRTRGFSEEFRATAELGYKWKDKLLGSLKSEIVESFMNGEPEGSAGNGIFSNNIEYVSFGPEVSYWMKDNLGLTIGVQGAFSGSFILAEPSYNFGVFLEIK